MIKLHFWTDVVGSSAPKARKALKAKVLKAISFFDAKWSGGKAKKNKSVEQLVRDLSLEKGVKFIGFAESVKYLLMDGHPKALESDWEHPFGAPTLLYAHKTLPILIIAGPDIMYNNSYVKKLNPDFMRDDIGGITD